MEFRFFERRDRFSERLQGFPGVEAGGRTPQSVGRTRTLRGIRLKDYKDRARKAGVELKKCEEEPLPSAIVIRNNEKFSINLLAPLACALSLCTCCRQYPGTATGHRAGFIHLGHQLFLLGTEQMLLSGNGGGDRHDGERGWCGHHAVPFGCV